MRQSIEFDKKKIINIDDVFNNTNDGSVRVKAASLFMNRRQISTRNHKMFTPVRNNIASGGRMFDTNKRNFQTEGITS